MHDLNRCFFDPFQCKPANSHKNMPYSPRLRQTVSQLAFPYTIPTPRLHLPYLCIFYNFPGWQIARGNVLEKPRIPGKGIPWTWNGQGQGLCRRK